ncbi:glycosyltransferase [Kocuria sp. M4R2S49]|uniref:glycosyltransferase n=1 Tax=Kocuria rhizosphaericola TaxID=3376284 RepID=UPI0037AD1A16
MSAAPRHVLLISLHTSPLEQPGSGDAGGMNVYVRHLAEALVDAGHTVDMATLDRGAGAPSPAGVRSTRIRAGLRLLTVSLPGAAGASKEDLPGFTSAFADVLRAAADRPGVVHAHYWLSGAAGRELADGWGVPLVLTLHTTALGKNLRARTGEGLEPASRAEAEAELIARAEATVVNTRTEALQMIEFYDADAARLTVITPGVDLSAFTPDAAPGEPRRTDERPPGTPGRPLRILFAGRLQALKGPHVLVDALARIRETDPGLPVELDVVGVGTRCFTSALRERVRELGLEDAVRFGPALPTPQLAARMRRADVVAVPSSSETFGLVALEAQACGTPVLATDVDGLRTAVLDGLTGRLVPDRDPGSWARAVVALAGDPDALERMGEAAARRAQGHSWERTALSTAEVYARTRARAGVRDGSGRRLNTLER